MLIPNEYLAQIDAEIAKLFSSTAAYIKGDGVSPSLFEQVFLAGKVAADCGPDKMRTMSAEQISTWARAHGVVRTEEDTAVLKILAGATDKWLAGMVDELSKRVRVEIATAESGYAAEVISRAADGKLRKAIGDDIWSHLKLGYLAKLGRAIGTVMSLFEHTLDRFLQTELAQYFQSGQSTGISSTEMIYKVPRPTACPHCMRLHIDANGAPLLYKLSDVQGNSNIGKKAGEWTFVVGPVHPHCYCILYRASKRAPTPSDLLANARKESLAVGLKKRKEILASAASKYKEALEATR